MIMNVPSNFVYYHCHTQLSNGTTNIDSITNYKQYVEAAKECGMTAMGFSEHGNCFEWLHKKEAIEKAGMKYIHAIEAYLTEDISEVIVSQTADIILLDGNEHKNMPIFKSYEREDGALIGECSKDGNAELIGFIVPGTLKTKKEPKKLRDNYHCVLIAKNYDGVKELNKMVSASFNRNDGHFYYMPRITFDELFATSENIIITTACLGGALSRGTESAREKMLNFIRLHKDRCFLEIQHHNCNEQIEYNRMLYTLSKEINVPLIAGTDTHALSDIHMDGRAIMQKAKKVHFSDEESWDLTFKTIDQLIAAYKKQSALPMDVIYEAIDNTNKMAEMIEPFQLDYNPKYPKLYSDSEGVFKQKINDGVIKRKIMKKPNYKEYVDRIHYEYDTYKHNNAIDFMLLEEDYKSEMRRRNIKFGYSRGSVSGSIIAYLLGITEIDSVKLKLNFERFMNVERISLADVDTDWLSEDRKVVKDYLYSKPGLYCCDIVTFNTVALKGAIRDVGRALEIPLEEINDICDQIEVNEPSLRRKYKELFKYVDLVNGCVVSVGNHPAGCVVSPFPVDEWIGTFTTSTDEYPISMLNMKEIDSLNFVKLDILGLDNIGLIYKTCDLVGIPFMTPDNTPDDDLDVWNSIKEDTTMIFQWESASATAYLKQLFSDSTIEKIREKNPNFSYIDLLSIGNGAIRPAGESYRDLLAQGIYRDNGNEALNQFLSSTLGYLVYQEQIIEFLHKFCGFTMGEADVVRRHFSKKTGTETDIPIIEYGGELNNSTHHIDGFIKTMKDKYDVDENDAKKIIVNFLQVIVDASDYLFSKNHSDPYSWTGYICGYLRYYYPLEFITTALNIWEDKEDKSLAIIEYAKKRGIKISPIKFRHSISKYNFDKNTNEIFKGIASIKYMNSTVADEIYQLRNNKYQSFMELLFDLKDKTSINSRQLRILIELDFFEEFGDANYLIAQYEFYDSLDGKKQLKKEKIRDMGIPEDQVSQFAEKETEKMYSGLKMRDFMIFSTKYIKYEKRTLREKIAAQIEHLGYLDISGDEYAGMVVVMEVNTKYAPKLKLYSLKNGTILDCRIDKRTYNSNKVESGNILKIISSTYKNKMKRTDEGQFVPVPGVKEIWLTKYKKTDL